MSTIPAEIIHGDLPLLLSDNETHGRSGELDNLSLNFVCSYPDWKTELATEGYVKGQKISGYHALFVEELTRGTRSEQTCEVTVNCTGLLETGDKRRRTLGVNGQQISVGPFEEVIIAISENEQGEDPTGSGEAQVKRRVPKLDEFGEVIYKTIVTPSGTAERWNVRQPVIILTDTYFVTAEPSMTTVGTAVTPSGAPTVAASPWTSYDQPIRANHPNGWVLDDRQVEELFNGTSGGLWAVTDTYGHYLTAVPD